MNKKLVYVVGASKSYASWLKDFQLTNAIEKANLIVFTGGEDVDPSIYNEPKNGRTSSNLQRDKKERIAFDIACDLEIPMLGICRGSQLLCALSGGRLIQHQENPHSVHDIETYDGKVIPITSSHHQAQYPYEMSPDSFKLIAWTENMSHTHQNGEGKEISDKPFKEAEIVYYPKTNALGIQGHPEWMNEKRDEETITYLNNLVSKFLNKTL
jgi:gamma-glutamyl-gamma-aminobutyrate hydrolase PuuD